MKKVAMIAVCLALAGTARAGHDLEAWVTAQADREVVMAFAMLPPSMRTEILVRVEDRAVNQVHAAQLFERLVLGCRKEVAPGLLGFYALEVPEEAVAVLAALPPAAKRAFTALRPNGQQFVVDWTAKMARAGGGKWAVSEIAQALGVGGLR